MRKDTKIIGIAPLLLQKSKALFIGSSDVFDYQDFLIVSGYETDFYNLLLTDLRESNIEILDLQLVRQDSTVYTHLVGCAHSRGLDVKLHKEDVALEMSLPATWDTYLNLLASSHRHNIKRKIRRLGEAGTVNYNVIDKPTQSSKVMDTFFHHFRRSREDKASFMTVKMEQFFRSLIDVMAGEKLLKIGVLDLDTSPIASVLCFDDNSTVYLYNSGYDPHYHALSPGVVCKALSIKHSIQLGRKIFSFLKGAETYKYRMGGGEVPLYSCTITL